MSFTQRSDEPIPEIETNVWACSNDECNGWMRESYSFEADPKCPLCKSEMEKEVRLLPELS